MGSGLPSSLPSFYIIYYMYISLANRNCCCCCCNETEHQPCRWCDIQRVYRVIMFVLFRCCLYSIARIHTRRHRAVLHRTSERSLRSGQW